MEEIKLYHKVWTFLPVLLIQLALTIVFLIPITQGKNASFWIWNWSLMLFSGLVFLWELYVVLRERVWHKPFITITEDKVIVTITQNHENPNLHHIVFQRHIITSSTGSRQHPALFVYPESYELQQGCPPRKSVSALRQYGIL